MHDYKEIILAQVLSKIDKLDTESDIDYMHRLQDLSLDLSIAYDEYITYTEEESKSESDKCLFVNEFE